MKVAIIQMEMVWENAEANRNRFSAAFDSIHDPVDLIVLPEMFTTGFTMSPASVWETMNGETVSWMKTAAIKRNAALMGSVIIKDANHFYNRLLFVFPNGDIQHYDKKHLFSLAGEHKIFTPGKHKLIIDYRGWKICPLICYDLRFPVFSRNVEDYDLLIYVANWPKVRVNAWDTLLKARAIENLCYTIGVNRIGSDDNNHEYSGHSQAVDFLGNNLLHPQESTGVFIFELDKSEMHQTRQKLGFLNDKDQFTVVS